MKSLNILLKPFFSVGDEWKINEHSSTYKITRTHEDYNQTTALIDCICLDDKNDREYRKQQILKHSVVFVKRA